MPSDSKKSFVHLHNHSEFSLLDGASKIAPMVAAAVADGQPAMAITDHGNLYGLIDFYKECKKQGIKPLLGIEAYMAKHSVDDRPNPNKQSDDKLFYHLTVLAENNEGYKNLIKLSSDAFLKGFHRKPQVDWEILSEHSRGLLVTTGCLGGVVLQSLLHDRYDEALREAGKLQDIFGRDNMFVEIQDHGIPEQHRTNPDLLKIAAELGAGVVSSNDSHYPHREDHEAHAALLCQPAGTMVMMANEEVKSRATTYACGPLKPIEDICVGDEVVSFDRKRRRGIIRKQIVTNIGERHFVGNLVQVTTTSGRTSAYTPDHYCIARLDVALEGEYVVYLMKKGNSFRLGQCQYRRPRSRERPDWVNYGVQQRTKEQMADAIWIISTHGTSDEARKQEAWLSFSFGIPTWGFSEGRTRSHSPRRPYYQILWEMAGDLNEKASKLLSEYGRDIALPLWKEGDPLLSSIKQVTIHACNLMNKMLVCEPEESSSSRSLMNNGSGVWNGITVERIAYSGAVHSLEVEEDHSYIADGIVTHNCIQTNSMMDDPKRFKFEGTEHYVKSAREMRGLFDDFSPEACDNTLLIAEKCNVDIEFDQNLMPKFDVPEGFENEEDYLRFLVLEGAAKRFTMTDEVIARLEYELEVICSMGFPGYFLIVWDLVKHAKEAGIRVGPGRGSTGGAAIAYCLDITEIDPIKHGLLFERFLNPERVSKPDVDLDIDSRYREHMINYVIAKYGSDRVAQVVTFMQIKSRSAVRDASRVLGYQYSVGDKIAKALPPALYGVDTPLSQCLALDPSNQEGYDKADKLRKMYNMDPEVKHVVDVAQGLEGMRRSDGIHAAAVVIAPDAIINYAPVQKKPKGPIVTQYEMHGIEELGLLKMDFLGLRTLDVISDTLEMIKTRHKPIEIETISMDDEQTFALLSDARTLGVFQLEGTQMRGLLKSMEPDCYEDICALLALYRPGPMAANMHMDYVKRKTGAQAVEYFHEDAREILKDTYGLCISGTEDVLTPSGPVRICDIKVGDQICQGNTIGSVDTKVCTGPKAEVTIKLRTGREVHCSEDHLFLTSSGWVRASDLEGHSVATPRGWEEGEDSPESRARAVTMAGFLSEGHLSTGSSYTFANNDSDIRHRFIDSVFSGYGIGCSEYFNTRCYYVKPKRNAGQYLNPIRTHYKRLGLHGRLSGEKFVPDEIYSLCGDSRRAFLGMYMDCDGCITSFGIQIRTISERMAIGLHDLFLSVGVLATITNSSGAYTIHVRDHKEFDKSIKPYMVGYKKDHETTTISNRGSVEMSVRDHWLKSNLPQRSWSKRFNISRSLISTSGPIISRTRAERLGFESEYLYVSVDSVELSGRCPIMYDIEVTGDHTFVVGGVIAHNCIFQEELMQIAMKFAGYSLGDGYTLLKVCSKKMPEAMEAERDKFIGGMLANGYDEDLAEETFEMVSAFSNYAFGKAHSYGYGLITYQTAYLKANYPIEYMSALMTSAQSDHDDLGLYITETRRMGFEVLAPDINLSERQFTPLDDETIIFGLLAVKGIGEGPAQAIIEERAINGPYASFFDYCKRVDKKAFNKNVLEAIVSSGSFDSFGHARMGLVSIMEDVVKAENKRRVAELNGAMTLFDMEPEVVNVGVPNLKYPQDEMLSLEKKFLGVYLSGHPFEEVEDELRDDLSMTLKEVSELEEAEWGTVLLAGLVRDLEEKVTRKGDRMKVFSLEDLTGHIPCVLFPNQTGKFGHLVESDDIIAVIAKPSEDRTGTKLIINSVERIKRAYSKSPNIHVWLPMDYDQDNFIAAVASQKKSRKVGPVIIHTEVGQTQIPGKATRDSVSSMLGMH